MQEQEDERDVLRRLAGLGGSRTAGQQFRQRQAEAEDAGGPQAQEVAAGDPVAEAGRTTHCLPPKRSFLRNGIRFDSCRRVGTQAQFVQ